MIAAKPTLDRRDLIELIRSVFPHRMKVPLPIVRTGTYRDDEVIALEREFAGVEDWTSLSHHFVDQAPDGWSSALAFLSDEAICFFIPAFLVAHIADALQRADPVFALTHGFDGSHGNTHSRRAPINEEERWRRLDNAQCRAVVAYLQYQQCKEPIHQDAIAPALARYWLPRAA